MVKVLPVRSIQPAITALIPVLIPPQNQPVILNVKILPALLVSEMVQPTIPDAEAVSAPTGRRVITELVYLLLLRMDIVVVTVAVVRMKLGVRLIIARIVIVFVQRITDGLIVAICRTAVEPQAVPLPSWIASPTPSTV